MTIPRSASMLRRSRSASMSSLAQVDLNSLDPDIVLVSIACGLPYQKANDMQMQMQDYARKVMQLQPQAATSGEKLQMLFALSQKLMKWFLEDRERLQKRLNVSSTSDKTESPLPPLEPNESEKSSVASRILASVAPVTASDIKLAHIPDQGKDSIVCDESLSTRPAECSAISTLSDGMSDPHCLKTATENELQVPSAVLASTTSLPQGKKHNDPPKTDALQVYMQVQSSVICMQKYVRGFTVGYPCFYHFVANLR